MYQMSIFRKGVSSSQLSRELGITQKAAWHMLRRLREATGVSDILFGEVEVMVVKNTEASTLQGHNHGVLHHGVKEHVNV